MNASVSASIMGMSSPMAACRGGMRRRITGSWTSNLIAALDVADALVAAPREFAFLLDAIGGLALGPRSGGWAGVGCH